MDKENKDWLNDFEALKQVNSNNPFTVPEGYFAEMEEHLSVLVNLHGIDSKQDIYTLPENYFEELSSNIQSRIAVEEWVDADASQGFTAPANYFEELNGNIQSRVNIEKSVMLSEEYFKVPEDYFEELSSNIQSRINIEEVSLSGVSNFTVPENYFEELSGNIQSRVLVEEALAAHPEGFSVPANYFEQLTKQITDKTVAHQKEVVRRGVVRKLLFSSAFKYATAACFALVIGTGIFINQVFNPVAEHHRSYLHKALSNVPVTDIQGYLQDHVDATDTRTMIGEGKQINTENLNNDLQDYLDLNQ